MAVISPGPMAIEDNLPPGDPLEVIHLHWWADNCEPKRLHFLEYHGVWDSLACDLSI